MHAKCSQYNDSDFTIVMNLHGFYGFYIIILYIHVIFSGSASIQFGSI